MLKLWRQPLVQRKSRSLGFTLIELMIVIGILVLLAAVLIVVIVTVMGKGNKSATEATMGTLAPHMKSDVTLARNLANPSKNAQVFAKEFKDATGVASAAMFDKLTPMQRSKLLAFYIAASKEQWEKAIASAQQARYPFKPLVGENDAKAFLIKDSDGFNYIADAWGKAISYEFLKAAAEGAEPRWVLVSGGEDMNLETAADNLYHASWSGFNEGDYKAKTD